VCRRLALTEGQKENKERKKERQRMKKASVLLVVALLVFLMTSMCCLVRNGNAEVGVVGVKPGDWVKYSVTRLGSNLVWVYEEAVWVKVEVLNVSGSTLTVRETIHDADGREFVRNSSWNLLDRSYFRDIIATNLGPGDKIFETHLFVNETESMYVDLTLNDTDYRTYDGVTREVNQLRWTEISPYFLNMANHTYETYWDKATGFLLEEKLQGYLIGYEEWYETHPLSTYWLEIVDTNMWEMQKPQQSFLWLAAIPVGAVIVAVVTIKLRNNRKKNEADKQ
jgi:hypothetical protein